MFDGAAATDPMPLAMAIILGLALIASGVLLVTVAAKSRNGTLPRNWIVGIRTRTTLASDDAWHAAHRASATPLMIGGIGTIVAGVPLLLRPSNGWGLAFTSVGIVWLLIWVVIGSRAGTQEATRPQ